MPSRPPRCRPIKLIPWLLLGILGGCYDYIPVQVTLINSQNNLPQPGVRVRPNYEEGSGAAWADQGWRTTDANGKAILPVTIELTYRHQTPSGRFVTRRVAPSIIIDDANFSLQHGGQEEFLDVGVLRRASGLSSQSNPYPVNLVVDPHSAPTTDP